MELKCADYCFKRATYRFEPALFDRAVKYSSYEFLLTGNFICRISILECVTVKRLMTDTDPSVSVVIPTLPDRDMVVLPSLRAQTRDDVEVVAVSDQALNIAEARNEGITNANASLIAHTDDDCRVPTDWVETIVRIFQENPQTKLVEGGLEGYYTAPRHYLGANIAYRREAALAIGGFDSEFAGWREDTDFGWRMEDEYGHDACSYHPELAIEHIGPPQSKRIAKNEHRFRTRYPRRTFDLLYDPNSLTGQIAIKITQHTYMRSPLLGSLLSKLNPKL